MTPYAEKASKFTWQISDTRLRVILRKISTISCKKIIAKNKWFSAKNKCKSANMGSSTVQLHGVDLIDIQIQNLL